jgi:ABC-2 type transport system permease protein
MSAIWTLAVKDLRVLSRDKFGLFWVAVFPLMFALFFGSIFGGESHGVAPLKVAVVDEDQTEASRALVARLEKSPALQLVRPAEGDAAPLTREAARADVLKGKLVAYVVLKKGFGNSAGLFGGQVAALEVGIDPSRRAEKEMLRGLLTEAAFSGGQGTKVDGPALAWKPPQVEVQDVAPQESGPRSAYELIFPSAVLWGLMTCALTFAIGLVTERLGGTLLRLHLAPLSGGQVLAGKALACFLTGAGVSVGLLGVAWLLLGVRIVNPFGMVLAIVCIAWCFTGIMMFVSTLGKTQQSVAGAAWGVMMPLAMIGGAMVPLIAFPPWMLTVSNFSPVKWGIWALEGAIWRGFSLADMLLPCAILIGIGAACFAVGAKVLSRQEL